MAACLCQRISWCLVAMLRDSVVVVVVAVVVRTPPRAIPLAMITMRKSTHGLPFLSHMSIGLRLAAVRASSFILIYFAIEKLAFLLFIVIGIPMVLVKTTSRLPWCCT